MIINTYDVDGYSVQINEPTQIPIEWDERPKISSLESIRPKTFWDQRRVKSSDVDMSNAEFNMIRDMQFILGFMDCSISQRLDIIHDF